VSVAEEIAVLNLARGLVAATELTFEQVLGVLAETRGQGGLDEFERHLVSRGLVTRDDLERARLAVEMDSTDPSLTGSQPLPPPSVRAFGNGPHQAAARGSDALRPPTRSPPAPARTGGLAAAAAAAAAPAPATPTPTPTPTRMPAVVYEPGDARYEIVERIGRGGMGVIDVALDREIGRKVALKSLRPEAAASEIKRERFLQEARLTGRLEHPNIIPVYDIGRGGDGSAYFAMKLVRGVTLRDVLRSLAAHEPKAEAEYGRVNLLLSFQKMCQGMAYAHSRGVVHRDLKPENIMLGDYGEVLVMDWGIAKVLASPDGAKNKGLAPDTISSLRRGPGEQHTRPGAVLGSVRFMAPEQAMGRIDEIDCRSDVYSLGAILYEILTLEPPFDGPNARDILMKVREGTLVPPRKRTPERDIPQMLEAVVLRAMAREKDGRYANAQELSRALFDWMESARDQERRHRLAVGRIAAAREATARYFSEYRRANELRAQAAQLAAQVKPHVGLEVKRPIWQMEDDARAADEARILAFGEAVTLYHSALDQIPGNADARAGLAEVYWSRFIEADSQGDAANALYYRGRVQEVDDGRFAERIRGDGTLSVEVEPSGAHLSLFRFTEQERTLRPRPERELGTAPVRELTLPMGRYLLIASAAGRREVHLPFLMDRLEDQTLHVKLRRAEDVPAPFFVHVPGGDFLAGGDDLAGAPGPARARHVDDFALSVLPVTCAEYLAFLRALDRDSPREAYARAPRGGRGERALWRKDLEGRWAIPEEDEHGMRWEATHPITGVSFEDALEYCRWRAKTDKRAYRLPSEDEWEKAARGVDGRHFPWGDYFDPLFCNMEDSRDGPPCPAPVGSFDADASPYGVRDMAGGQREWCDGWFDDERTRRAIRGGGYNSMARACRAAYRHGMPPDHTDLAVGFRLAYDA
jgi:serine/threonine-protein kinase